MSFGFDFFRFDPHRASRTLMCTDCPETGKAIKCATTCCCVCCIPCAQSTSKCISMASTISSIGEAFEVLCILSSPFCIIGIPVGCLAGASYLYANGECGRISSGLKSRCELCCDSCSNHARDSLEQCKSTCWDPSCPYYGSCCATNDTE